MGEVEFEKQSMDPAAQELLKKAAAEGVETIFDRAKTMKPCPIGAEGACCRICAQGPCRVPPPKKKEGETGEEKKQRMGLCGATAETIVARNFARMVAAGTAAHSDHSRGVAKLFKEIAHGEAPGYDVKDVAKLKKVAKDWDVALTEGEGDDAKSRDKLRHRQGPGRQDPGGIRPAVRRDQLRAPGPQEAPGNLAQNGRGAPGHRHRGGGADAPHPHGRGPGIPQPHQAVHPLRPGRRLGRFHDLHRPPGHHVRLPDPHRRRNQPGRAERRPRQRHHARP